MIWGTGVGPYGHIAIVDSANVNTFVSMDQNWPVGSNCHYQNHNYNSVLGVLPPKIDVNFDQAAYEAQKRAEAEEAARIAAEKQAEADRIKALEEAAAKAEADRIAAEKAAAEKAEQARIAAEQEALDKQAEEKKAAEDMWYRFWTGLFNFLKGLLWK